MSLPVRQREVVSLRLFDDMSFAGIAELLDIKEQSARSNFHFGIMRLRGLYKQLEGSGHEFEYFWKKSIDKDLFQSKEELGNKEHLLRCRECRELVERMRIGLDTLKNEIRREEPATFWRDMRLEINGKVRPPGRILNLLNLLNMPKVLTVRWCGALVAVAMVVWVLVFRTSPVPIAFSEEEIALLVGTPELTNLQNIPAENIEFSTVLEKATTINDIYDFNGLMIDIAEKSI